MFFAQGHAWSFFFFFLRQALSVIEKHVGLNIREIEIETTDLGINVSRYIEEEFEENLASGSNLHRLASKRRFAKG